MIFGLLGAIVAGLALALAFSMFRSPREDAAMTSGLGDPPQGVRRWTLALRVVGDEDEALARTLLGGASQDQVVDLLRLAPSATHYYAGEAVADLRCDLAGGIVLRLDTDAAHLPVENLAGVLSLLRGLGEHPMLRLREAKLSSGGCFLFSVDESARPGHRLCRYCNQSYVETELECPSCGAAAVIEPSNPR